MDKIFPIVKQFDRIKFLASTVMLKEDFTVHHRSFRKGTIFTVLGWRELAEVPYLIISKGSWESMVEYQRIFEKLELCSSF